MAKKPRSQRYRKEVENSSKKMDDNAADYLSDTHTIVSLVSDTGTNISFSGNDDGWNIDNGDEYNEGPDDNALKNAEMRQQRLNDILKSVDDFCSEKRSSKRESLLRQWFRGFTQYATNYSSKEAIRSKLDDIVQACQCGIKSRSGLPAEQYAACRVLEGVGILLGDEEYFEMIYDPILKRLVQSNHRAVKVRVAALRAIGISVYIGVEDEVITEQMMDLCEALAQVEYRGNSVPSFLRAAALEVWTLLSTTINDLFIAGQDDVSTGRGLMLLPLLLTCLEQEDAPELRSAAGECVAYIHTARLQLGDDGNNDNKWKQGSWEKSDFEEIMAEIEQCFVDLSTQSGHYMSKRAKKEQRATFREYLGTIQDNSSPFLKVQFQGGSLELNCWKYIVALNFIRRALQSAFQIQLFTNPTLQTIFGVDANVLNSANSQYSQLEKRLFLSKTSEASKAKDLDRTNKRRNRTNAKNQFLAND